ncbi:hypothetical protein CGZ93_06040 [Enemella dayhoffiae]|uniref:Uncharacterized protein n=1 Tax=Enemella dayhoffiae TaxID=2016507 RepID=A0A255H7E8_9ACTN|nr:hypothetical protein CGZ93_06040 [Enemella dayhoffiae]
MATTWTGSLRLPGAVSRPSEPISGLTMATRKSTCHSILPPGVCKLSAVVSGQPAAGAGMVWITLPSLRTVAVPASTASSVLAAPWASLTCVLGVSPYP